MKYVAKMQRFAYFFCAKMQRIYRIEEIKTNHIIGIYDKR